MKYQIRLSEESRAYTTFITLFGRYNFCKLPFGISAAPEFFQRQMVKILESLEGVVCMMDDILVVGSMEKEHDEWLRRVLERIEEAGMTLNKEKCEFKVREVKFLGHVMNNEGVKVDLDKELAIRNMPAPTDRKGLRRFIAMVNYLSRFSPDLAEVQLPLRELDKDRTSWSWTEYHQASYEKVKDVSSSAPVLALFDIRKQYRVTADAGRHTLDAPLLQEQGAEW